MAVHLNTIPAQAGEFMRALIEVESVAQDDIDPAIDVQIRFADFTAAGGSYCRIPLTSADIVKLARLTNNFNLLNLVISDEPGSGPVPPPPPVTRDTSGDVAAGAPVVSAGAEAVPAAVRDTDAAIAAGAPSVDADAARVEPGDADTGGDVRASAPGYQPMPKSYLRATRTPRQRPGRVRLHSRHALKRSGCNRLRTWAATWRRVRRR